MRAKTVSTEKENVVRNPIVSQEMRELKVVLHATTRSKDWVSCTCKGHFIQVHKELIGRKKLGSKVVIRGELTKHADGLKTMVPEL